MVTNEAPERVTSISDNGEMLVRVRLSGFACSLIDKHYVRAQPFPRLNIGEAIERDTSIVGT